jgi:diamine N-acetyltransferase
MAARVTLKNVTAGNWEQVVDLEPRDDQEAFVASNAYSLAESKFDPYTVPRAIYAGREPVGFLMYESLTDDGRANDYMITRFMIDAKHQAKGYGREALQLALEEIRARPGATKISICYAPANAVAKDFYASFGFREVGHDEDGEMIAEIEIAAG